MKIKYFEASELPENEKVYLRKDFLGWRVVEPFLYKDNKIDWIRFVFGGKRALFNLIVIMLMLTIYYMAFHEVTSQMEERVENPCLYCNKGGLNYSVLKENYYNELRLNVSELNLSSSVPTSAVP